MARLEKNVTPPKHMPPTYPPPALSSSQPPKLGVSPPNHPPPFLPPTLIGSTGQLKGGPPSYPPPLMCTPSPPASPLTSRIITPSDSLPKLSQEVFPSCLVPPPKQRPPLPSNPPSMSISIRGRNDPSPSKPVPKPQPHAVYLQPLPTTPITRVPLSMTPHPLRHRTQQVVQPRRARPSRIIPSPSLTNQNLISTISRTMLQQCQQPPNMMMHQSRQQQSTILHQPSELRVCMQYPQQVSPSFLKRLVPVAPPKPFAQPLVRVGRPYVAASQYFVRPPVKQLHSQSQQPTAVQQPNLGLHAQKQMVTEPIPIPKQYDELYSTHDPPPPGYQCPVPKPTSPVKIKRKSTKLETQHDLWYNMNEIVVENIMQTQLWKYEISMSVTPGIEGWKTQVLKNVKDLDPITRDKLPSPAWCYLFWLCLLAPSKEDVEEMIDTDKPPILRGIVFLYLRIVGVSKRLWFWFSRYLHEKTEVLRDYRRSIKIGEFLVSLLKENKYASTHIDFSLPRIPVPIHRAYRKKIYMMEIIDKENKQFKNVFRKGAKVLALYHDDQGYYPATVYEVLENGNYQIRFDEYDTEQEVCLGQMKLVSKDKHRRDSSSSRSPSSDRNQATGKSGSKLERWGSERPRKGSRKRKRSKSRSKSRSRTKHKVPRYGDLDSYIERMIRKEDMEEQSWANPRNRLRKVLGENQSMKLQTMFQNCRQIDGMNQFVVDMPMNREVVRVRRRERRDLKRDKEIQREQEKNWKPSKEYQQKLAKLKKRYG